MPVSQTTDHINVTDLHSLIKSVTEDDNYSHNSSSSGMLKGVVL